ncbi:MAG: Nicotine blue oxidoreductase [Alphaproteobacteria bacterium MarineAlpha11_Bin1]|nr:MAG: Nicotine blue oxidoreductase [Alphaproteobacteria bacterium MarineAlpha11_Bin1]|tara:strand:- start:335 stop:1963 length:1629 start_codon:yes stop_codon:yes gene_type:complete
MKFGETVLEDAEGAILAHSLLLHDGVLRKGRILTKRDVARIKAKGIQSVIAARLEEGDLNENEAALEIAAALQNEGLTATGGNTGRANLRAATGGVALIDAETIHRINAIDEAVTVSTVRPYDAVPAGHVLATIKIITFGVSRDIINRCIEATLEGNKPIRLAAYTPQKIGFVQTLLPGLKKNLIAKASDVTSKRLSLMNLDIADERHCAHDIMEITKNLIALEGSGCSIALVLGASAIVDRRDTVPSAIKAAGGEIEHLGLPVDPGNLLLFARIGKMRVLGIPSSARSPRLHGFDWVLQRLVAGLDVTSADLTRMGVGGMLKEMPGRPLSREQEELEDIADQFSPTIGGVLLAAGQSRRMGTANKMLVEVKGIPMIVHAARAMLASNASPIVVVLGHQSERVERTLSDQNVMFVRNPDYRGGLSTSLRAGLAALPKECDGAVVALADMPGIHPDDINMLINEFDPISGQSIIVPTHGGKRGNPVIWARRFFSDISAVSGDVGARHLIGANIDQVIEVETDNPGVLIDLDTPEAIAEHNGNA